MHPLRDKPTLNLLVNIFVSTRRLVSVSEILFKFYWRRCIDKIMSIKFSNDLFNALSSEVITSGNLNLNHQIETAH